MTIILLVVAIFVSSIIGYLIVSLITYNIPDLSGFTWIKITLGIGVGYGVTSILSFIWQVAFGNFDVLYPVFELFLVSVLYWWLQKIKKQQTSFSSLISPRVSERSRWVVLLQFSLGCGMLLGIVTFVLGTIIAPSGMWDAWMVQNRAARFFYLGGDNWTNAFSPLLVSADYPLLVGMSVARLWRYAGHETIFGPVLFAFTITSALIGFLIASMSYFRGRVFASLVGLALLTSSALFVFAPAQLADIPIAFYFLATIVVLRLHESNPSSRPPLLLMAGLTSALALWAKNEGWLFVIAVFISYFILATILKQKAFQIVSMARFVLGLLPVLLVVLFFKFVFAPAFDFLRHQSVDLSLADRLFNPSRYLIIIQGYLTQSYDLTPDRSTPVLALFFIALLFGIDLRNWKDPSFISGFFVLMAMIAGEFAVYLLTPNDLRWQVSSSIHRLSLQLWPIFVFEIMMLIKVPGFMRND
jgi:hypothetical protein